MNKKGVRQCGDEAVGKSNEAFASQCRIVLQDRQVQYLLYKKHPIEINNELCYIYICQFLLLFVISKLKMVTI